MPRSGTTYLPDTNILVDALNNKRGRRQALAELLAHGDWLACCSVTLAEVYSGMRAHEAALTDAFMSSLLWHDVSRKIVRRAGRLRFDWARQGVTLSLFDTLIAAIALEHGLTLITANTKHFPMPELAFYSLPEKSSPTSPGAMNS